MQWSDEMIQAVWEKGTPAANNSPSEWRQDACGAWMSRSQYGNRDSQYGWEIDHIAPKGPDVLGNLRPLQWENNASRGDGHLIPVVTSSGTENVFIRR